MSYPHNDDCTGGDPAHVRRTLINDRGWPRDLTKYRVIEGQGQRVEVVEVATLDIDQPDLFEEPV